MDASRVEQVVEVLRQEEARLQAIISELEKNREDVRSLLERVRAGITALTGKNSGRASKKGQNVVWLTTDEVAGYIVSVLQEHGVQAEDPLREKVTQLAAQAGKARSGLGLRFTKALQDKRFVLGPDGWRLAEPALHRTASGLQA